MCVYVFMIQFCRMYIPLNTLKAMDMKSNSLHVYTYLTNKSDSDR